MARVHAADDNDSGFRNTTVQRARGGGWVGGAAILR
jgi:hypothetical protein